MYNETDTQSGVPIEELVQELKDHIELLDKENSRLEKELQNRDTQIGEYKGIVERNEFLRPHADRLVGLMGFTNIEELIAETESRSIGSRFQYRFIQLLVLPLKAIRSWKKRKKSKD